MKAVQCPQCGDDYCYFITEIPKQLFHSQFKQGCFVALLAQCEADGHQFVVTVGMHKGQVLIETALVTYYGGEAVVAR